MSISTKLSVESHSVMFFKCLLSSTSVYGAYSCHNAYLCLVNFAYFTVFQVINLSCHLIPSLTILPLAPQHIYQPPFPQSSCQHVYCTSYIRIYLLNYLLTHRREHICLSLYIFDIFLVNWRLFCYEALANKVTAFSFHGGFNSEAGNLLSLLLFCWS